MENNVFQFVEKTFLRSGGPGGQNVNKRETKVRLVFDILNAALSRDEKNRLLRKFPNGFIAITCDTTRSQKQNISIAFKELRASIETALFIPKYRKKTIPAYRTVRGKKKKRLKENLIKYRRRFELS